MPGTTSLHANHTYKVTPSRKTKPSRGGDSLHVGKGQAGAALALPPHPQARSAPCAVNTPTSPVLKHTSALSGLSLEGCESSSAPGPLSLAVFPTVVFSPLVTTVQCLSLAPGPWTLTVLTQKPIQHLYPDVPGISNLTCRGQKE